jgi:hypothetical protein
LCAGYSRHRFAGIECDRNTGRRDYNAVMLHRIYKPTLPAFHPQLTTFLVIFGALAMLYVFLRWARSRDPLATAGREELREVAVGHLASIRNAFDELVRAARRRAYFRRRNRRR